jgi:hypothetical protein
MLVSGSFEDSWRSASHEEREHVYVRLVELHRHWQAQGATLVCTMDNLDTAGRPAPGGANFYSIWEIPSPALIHDFVEPFWHGENEMPLTTHFSIRVTLGKPIISLERDLGGVQRATTATAEGEMQPIP